MAKLSVVVPSNEVEVGGVKYRKVERKAQAGDIVKVLVDDYTDVEEGAYYSVINKEGETGFYDDDGDFRDDAVQYYPKDFEVYEKVTEPAAVEYREVKREAAVGERIRIVKRHAYEDEYENGAEFIAIEVDRDGDVRVNTSRRNRKLVLLSEYVVLEPVNVAKPAEPVPYSDRLKVGEYAKVVNPKPLREHKRGHFVEITNDDRSEQPFRGLCLTNGKANWYYEGELVRATESEVEAAKKAAERAKKIGEFADGGYAVVKSDADGYLSGGYRESYVKVRPTEVAGPYALEISLPEQRGYGGYCNADALRKVTREEYEEATKPKPVFNVGDYAKVTCDVMEFRRDDIVMITQDKSCGYISSIFDFEVDRIGKNAVGFINANNIVKISAEEVARIEEEAKWTAIGRKVNEYKAGDVVRVTKACHIADTNVGDVTTIARLGGGGNGVFLAQLNRGGHSAFIYDDEIELLAPVEQRFDRAEGGASLSK